MWLPETAVNDATLRVLIDHGMKFVILSPHQAKRVRRFSISEIEQTATGQEANPTGAASDQQPATIDAFRAGEWTGVEHGEIDTRQAYRWFDKEAGHRLTDRYIDIFFYHGGLSRGVGFEHLLRDAKNFSQRIDDCFTNNGATTPELVSIATDGETYGHHERFGEMGLAYLLNIEAPQRHIRVTNYAEFLAENPPVMEVELKEGPNGEGTAWSCAHGVGRWSRNCGCRGDGPPEWNQEWRAPLRQALDNLRDELAALTMEIGEPLLKDVWEARNDYIEVILRRAPESFDEFLAKHQKRPLAESERIDMINLMEMQRQTQLMYTSCGWFFTELSGLETVQVIQYAARALRLAENLSPALRGAYEERFLADLKKARSNMTEYKHGENVYKKLVKSSMVTFPRVVNTHAIRSLFAGAPAQERLYHYAIQRSDLVEKRTEQTTLMIGRVEVQSGVTTSKHAYAFALINHGAGEGVKCFVRRVDGSADALAGQAGWNYAEAREALIADFSKHELKIIDELPQRWGGEAFDLGAMLAEERQQVISILLEGRLSEISEFYARIYTQNRHQMQALRELGAALPAELSVPARYTLSRQLREEIMKLHNVTDPEAYKPCLEIARAARRLGLQLENQQPSQLFQNMIEQRLQHLFNNGAGQACKEIAELVDIADKLKLALDETSIQNHIFAILQQHLDGLIDRILAAPQIEQEYDCVSSFLNIAYRFNFNIKKYKDRLKPVEQAWSQDPRYWP
jgi:hypothetical protein